MFSNANHTQIVGGQFSIVNQQGVSSRNGIDVLRGHCALGALLDSNERFDPPRCAAETREALIAEILAWIYGSDRSALIAWLYGGAGAGKSALAQTIAEICQSEGQLAGSFFFSRTSTADRSDGSRLIPTLVFQIIEALPELKPHIQDCINKHSGLFDRAPRTQMDLLLVKPLTRLAQLAAPIQTSSTALINPISSATSPLASIPPIISKPKSRRRGLITKIFGKPAPKAEAPVETEVTVTPPQPQSTASTNDATESTDLYRPRLIVIDGLDECNGQDIQTELLRILASAIPHIPIPFRFLIASRPEGHIKRTINHDDSFRRLNVRRIDLGDDVNADDDIRRFLMRGFEEIHRTHPLLSLLDPSWPSNEAIATLVQKSSSHFIYASTAMKYVQYARGRPDKRLEIILGLSIPPTTDKPFAQLDALYTHIFMSVEEHDRVIIKRVFGILIIAGDHPYGYNIETSPAQLEEYLGMQAGEVNLLFEPLLSLVTLPEHRQTEIKVLHASLFDFLQDASRSSDLHFDPKKAHDIMAKYWFQDLLTYKLDDILSKDTMELLEVHLVISWRFLGHCYSGHVSEELKEYLISFPFLYDIILDPPFILKYLSIKKLAGLGYISILFQLLFTVLVEKKFDNGQHLQSVHATQIEQRLQSIQGGRDSGLLNNTSQEPLFNDLTLQNLHRVHKSFLDMFLRISDVEYLSEILNERGSRHGPDDTERYLRAHFLVIFLPHLPSKDVSICEGYASMTGYIIGGESENELYRVLRRRVEEYLRRVEGEAIVQDLEACKSAWGII